MPLKRKYFSLPLVVFSSLFIVTACSDEKKDTTTEEQEKNYILHVFGKDVDEVFGSTEKWNLKQQWIRNSSPFNGFG